MSGSGFISLKSLLFLAAAVALVVSLSLGGDSALAQGKPDFAGKPDWAGKFGARPPKGGRGEEAKELSRERGKKKGWEKKDDDGDDRKDKKEKKSKKSKKSKKAKKKKKSSRY